MDFKIETNTNMYALAEGFRKFAYNDLRKASRYAINRTLITIRKQSIIELRKKLNLRPGLLTDKRSRYIKVLKAKPGQSLLSQYGSVSFGTGAIPLMEFVKNGKNIRSQKAIRVKNRRNIKVMVNPGRTTELKRAFIQRGNASGKLQVFVRRRGGFKALTVNSVGSRIVNQGIGARLQALGGQRFRGLFLAYLQGKSSAFDGVQRN